MGLYPFYNVIVEKTAPPKKRCLRDCQSPYCLEVALQIHPIKYVNRPNISFSQGTPARRLLAFAQTGSPNLAH